MSPYTSQQPFEDLWVEVACVSCSWTGISGETVGLSMPTCPECGDLALPKIQRLPYPRLVTEQPDEREGMAVATVAIFGTLALMIAGFYWLIRFALPHAG